MTGGTADESKSAATRVRILDAAAQVLSAKGYAGLRLTDVAAQAEIQAPAIYYYYASRDELIEAVTHLAFYAGWPAARWIRATAGPGSA